MSRRSTKKCRRCLRPRPHGYNWPEGYVCDACFMAAVRVRGKCPGCGDERLLPGRHVELGAICVSCAGITTSFICATCGEEAQHYYARTCFSCSLERRLRQVLDDGTGQVAAALEPLFESLRSMANPVAGMNWLKKPEVEQRLSSLACGTTPLTHEGIDTMPGPQGREFLRELLVDTGLVPKRDKYLEAFKTWCPKRLSSIADAATRNEISIYLAWRHMKDLTVRSEAGHLTAAVTAAARDPHRRSSEVPRLCGRTGTAAVRGRPERHRRLVRHRLQPVQGGRLHLVGHEKPKVRKAQVGLPAAAALVAGVPERPDRRDREAPVERRDHRPRRPRRRPHRAVVRPAGEPGLRAQAERPRRGRRAALLETRPRSDCRPGAGGQPCLPIHSRPMEHEHDEYRDRVPSSPAGGQAST